MAVASEVASRPACGIRGLAARPGATVVPFRFKASYISATSGAWGSYGLGCHGERHGIQRSHHSAGVQGVCNTTED